MGWLAVNLKGINPAIRAHDHPMIIFILLDKETIPMQWLYQCKPSYEANQRTWFGNGEPIYCIRVCWAVLSGLCIILLGELIWVISNFLHFCFTDNVVIYSSNYEDMVKINWPLTGGFHSQRASNTEMFPFDDVIMWNKDQSCKQPINHPVLQCRLSLSYLKSKCHVTRDVKCVMRCNLICCFGWDLPALI